jgi:hypothetical protein
MREYGENPDPNEEKIEREVAEKIYFQKIVNQMIKENGLEKVVKQKRKRTVPDIRYQKFYNEANELSSNIGRDSDKKTELLIKYFPGRFGDKGRNPVSNMDYLKVGSLFNKLVNYSRERIEQ